ncbi:glycerol uptake facilitator protein [Filimonas lacunae]|uniref:Glycerol uptake facilitator protein n=2 Tax=Filimonas lacunae TaxID=477680 RepID=A0A1N7QE90_9BACT|nr:MIP/aquaporin family protein [Filimonas lacunae]SIT21124.1 glycerol uptake facilitator protein [Filimonas lacunae]
MMSPIAAEVIGTAILILLGGGVCSNVSLNKSFGQNSGWIVITFGWALAVFAGVVIAGPVSGAHLNPAVTVGLAITGKFAWAQVPAFIAAQLAGAFIGAMLNYLMYKKHFDATSDRPDAQLGVFCTGPAIKNTPLNILSEVIGTFVLVYCVLHFSSPQIAEGAEIGMGSIGALPVTFIVLAIGLSLGGTTGYAINPARDLAPRLVHYLVPMQGKGSSNWSYAWIPVVGPVLGAIVAAIIYLQIG